MRKMKEQTKVILVKAYILFMAIYLIILVCIGIAVESGLKPQWELLSLVGFIVYSILGIIMVVLMSKVDIAPSKVSPVIKSINIKSYGVFRDELFNCAVRQGFEKPYSLPVGESVESMISFKEDAGATYVLQTIWMEELDLEILDEVTEAFWEETKLHVGEKKIEREAVGLMQCICVKRINAAFRKLISQNVPQDFKRYQILVGISFGGKKAYICRTKGGFYRSYYNHLKKTFEVITESMMIETKE